EVKRFAEIVIRACLETDHLVGGRTLRGEHDNGHILAGPANGGEPVIPRHARQTKVENDKCITYRAQREQRFGAIPSPVDGEPRLAQSSFNTATDQVIIFDEKN